MEPTWQKKKRQTAQRDELFSTSTHTAASFSSSRSPDQGAAVEFSSWNTGNYGRGGATGERTVDPEVVAQRRMVQRALQQHKSTTASAERSLQIAETCLDIGSATLEEVARQGESLDKAERGLELMEDEVEEAASLINFMRRCCLFQVLCCCCSDSKEDIKRDRTRKKRLKNRRGDEEVVRRAMSLASEDKRKHFEELVSNGHVPPEVGSDQAGVLKMSPSEQEAFKVAAKYHGKGGSSTAMIPFTVENSRQESNAAVQSGAMTEGEIQEISEESLKQDKLLSQIDKTMDKLKALGMAMYDELEEQEPQIDNVTERVYHTKTSLNDLSRRARKI